MSDERRGNIGIWNWDVNTRRITWSPDFEDLTSLDRNESYEAFRSRVHPDDFPAVESELDAAIRNRKPFDLEFRIVLASGEIRWLYARGRGHYDQNGCALCVVGNSIDITERKHLEESHRRSVEMLQEREQRFRLALKASGAGSWMRDFRTDRVDRDDRFREIYGFTADEPISFEAWLSRVHEEDREWVLDRWHQILQTKTHDTFDSTFRIRRPDGTVSYIQSVGQVQRDADGQVTQLIGFELDVTEQRRAEEALRSVSAELRQTIDISATGLTHCSRDLRYLSANAAYARLVGLPLEQIIGRRIVEVKGEAAFDIIRPRIEQVLRGETIEYEDALPIAGVRKWIRVAYTPDRDASGNVVGWVASVMDISQYKRLEEERAEEGRRKDEFLSFLGHELRNPLATISTAVQLLSAAVTDQERMSLNGMMDRQVKLMRRLLDDLLDLGRITHGHIQLKNGPINLANFLQYVTQITRSDVAERRQEMILRLPAENITFAADEARLEQIAVNLLSNASKYTPQGGRIEFSGAREDSEVVFRCKDNGRGIPPEMQQKIFEPFTRVGPLSNSRGEASLGIGLALVKRLVELHRGKVSVESGGPGTGSEFVVRLPLESALFDQPAPPETKPQATLGGSGSIILIEDNADAAGTMVIALERAGYRVTLFTDASSTLAGLEDLKPSAILLDIGLPDMNGYELAANLRRKPNLQDALLIAISGFKRHQESAAAGDFDYYFTKPVNLSSLLNLLDSHIQSRQTPAQSPSSEGSALRVLLIDDHAPLVAATAELLKEEGIEVRTALSGDEGLRFAPGFRPQLVLCDLNLPDMSGPEVIRKLRSTPDTRYAYSAIVTGLSESEIRTFNDEAPKMGVDEFIPKPLTREVVHSLVTKLKRLRAFDGETEAAISRGPGRRMPVLDP